MIDDFDDNLVHGTALMNDEASYELCGRGDIEDGWRGGCIQVGMLRRGGVQHICRRVYRECRAYLLVLVMA